MTQPVKIIPFNDIPELIKQLNSIIDALGTLGDLSTANKTSLVGAINSIPTDDLLALHTTDKTSIVGAINSVLTLTGLLTALTTTDKTSLVKAINELVTAVTTLTNSIGNLTTLTYSQHYKFNLLLKINGQLFHVHIKTDFSIFILMENLIEWIH
jgi:hypothetical protein